MATCTMGQEYEITATKDVEHLFFRFSIHNVALAHAATRNLRAMGYEVSTRYVAAVRAVQS